MDERKENEIQEQNVEIMKGELPLSNNQIEEVAQQNGDNMNNISSSVNTEQITQQDTISNSENLAQQEQNVMQQNINRVPEANNRQYSFWQNQSGIPNAGQYSNQNTQNINPQMMQNGFVPQGMPNAPYMQMSYGNIMQQPVQKKKREYKLLKKVGKAALVGIVAGTGFCGIVFGANKLGIIDQNVFGKNGKNTEISTTVISHSAKDETPSDLSSVVNKCMPSIVSINTVTTVKNPYFYGMQEDTPGSGSGIILKISDEDILIATNNHVISGAKKIAVGFNGTKSEDDMVQATVKGKDSTKDLAVVLVKIKDVPEKVLKNIAAAEVGSSDDVQVGQMAIAIGNALGYGQSMTVGYISAKDRGVEVEDGSAMKLLQTDAAINPGNSGGALLNAEGQVIGINSAKYADTTVEGMGFAIPISDAISTIDELMDREILKDDEKGYLGISGTNITEEVQAQYANMPLGIYVSQVSDDGAAKAAGIVVGDIIVGVGDEEITKIEALQEKVNSYRVGTKVTLKIKRYESGKYKTKEIEVTLKGKKTLDSITKDSNQSTDQNSDNEQNQQTPNNGNQTNPFGDNDDLYQQYYDYYFGK